MKHQELNYWNNNNIRIFYQSWRENITKKGIILIIHGIVEHSGRYDSLARELVNDGYIVYGFDLLGHGKSEGRKCFVNDFNEFVDSVYDLTNIIKKNEDQNLPLFILGHSMGSLIGLLYSERYNEEISGMILSGVGYSAMRQPNKLVLSIARLFSPLIGRLQIPAGINEELLTSNPLLSEKRKNDKLVSRKITLKLGIELYKTYNRIKKTVKSQNLPILMQGGEIDKVVYHQKKLFKDIGPITDKKLEIYPNALHEIYNEIEDTRKQAYNDIISWLDEHIK